jgi:putative endonuclease
VGVTSDLARRVWDHREGVGSVFCRRHRVRRLVYKEPFEDIQNAIHREKRLKKWERGWKVALIEYDNPNWDDLYDPLNW